MTFTPAIARLVGRRAALMPGATLRGIHASSIELATCEAPGRFYAAPKQAEVNARRTAWACLKAAHASRRVARMEAAAAADGGAA